VEISALTKSALDIRKTLLRMHFEAKSSHLGTGLSEIDLLTYLWGRHLAKDDRMILSKGHGGSGLYATLDHFKRMPDGMLKTYYKDGTKLAAHPSPLAIPEIPIATGSLGHGLSVAAGLAYAIRLKGEESKRKVVALLSDGECNEGSIWEAALFAGHHQFTNLSVVVDYNGLQGFGRTEEVLNLEPFADKWRAFGFEVRSIDGHNFGQMMEAFESPRKEKKPLAIVAKTIKGKGVSFMENTLDWHYLNLNQELFDKAMAELEAHT
jgi:transketolase